MQTLAVSLPSTPQTCENGAINSDSPAVSASIKTVETASGKSVLCSPVKSQDSKPPVSAPGYTPPGPAGSLGAPPSPENLRDRLLTQAGITEPEQVDALKEAWATKRALLKAKTVKLFSHEGLVTDSRTLEDNRIQLDAAEAVDRFLGVVAPRADAKVEIVHRLELPSWALPDGALPSARVIEIEGLVEPPA